jgi:hypothetical protein
MKRIIGRILRKILPYNWYKLAANGFIIVPSYYKSIFIDIERYMDLATPESSEKDIMLMRKYAHILDKGLHRKDVEVGHSSDIYKLLKQKITKLKESQYAQDPTYKWAIQKLIKYEHLQNNPDHFQPFIGKFSSPKIDYEDLLSLIKSRRSNRVFQSKTIPIEIIVKLKESVNWAANSCNKQPIKLFTTNDPSLSKKCLACCKGGTGFGDFIPSFWVFTSNCKGYVWPEEMYLPVLDTSLGAQNVFLIAQTLGISGTILSWAQKTQEEENEIRNLLNIPIDYIIIFCAVMGYPEFQYETPIRKTIG